MRINKDSAMLIDVQYIKESKKDKHPDYLYLIWKDLDKNETLKEKMHNVAENVKEKAEQLKENMHDNLEEVKTKADVIKCDLEEKAHDVKEKVAEKIEEFKDKKDDKE